MERDALEENKLRQADVVRAPPLKAGAPVGNPRDSAGRRGAEAFEHGFEIEPRLWSELGRAQSNSSVAGGSAS
jgi:hypothetical protein